MASNICSVLTKWFVLGIIVFFLSACIPVMAPRRPVRRAPAPPAPAPAPTYSEPSPQKPSPAETPPREPTPRAVASLTLAEQGRMLIQEKRADDAIRTLERAMNLYPKNGEVYYYLAEAWLLKGNVAQATEYNRLAGIYLSKNPQWGPKVERQRKTILSH